VQMRLGSLLPLKRSFVAWILALYALPVAILLACTWHNTRPEYHGFDWVLVSFLTYPGCVWGILLPRPELFPIPFEVLIGLALNTIGLCLLAWLASRFVRRR
jgi:hypothetical protein